MYSGPALDAAAEVCGNWPDAPIDVAGDRIVVRFKSDASVNDWGWRLSVEAVVPVPLLAELSDDDSLFATTQPFYFGVAVGTSTSYDAVTMPRALVADIWILRDSRHGRADPHMRPTLLRPPFFREQIVDLIACIQRLASTPSARALVFEPAVLRCLLVPVTKSFFAHGQRLGGEMALEVRLASLATIARVFSGCSAGEIGILCGACDDACTLSPPSWRLERFSRQSRFLACLLCNMALATTPWFDDSVGERSPYSDAVAFAGGCYDAFVTLSECPCWRDATRQVVRAALDTLSGGRESSRDSLLVHGTMLAVCGYTDTTIRIGSRVLLRPGAAKRWDGSAVDMCYVTAISPGLVTVRFSDDDEVHSAVVATSDCDTLPAHLPVWLVDEICSAVASMASPLALLLGAAVRDGVGAVASVKSGLLQYRCMRLVHACLVQRPQSLHGVLPLLHVFTAIREQLERRALCVGSTAVREGDTALSMALSVMRLSLYGCARAVESSLGELYNGPQVPEVVAVRAASTTQALDTFATMVRMELKKGETLLETDLGDSFRLDDPDGDVAVGACLWRGRGCMPCYWWWWGVVCGGRAMMWCGAGGTRAEDAGIAALDAQLQRGPPWTVGMAMVDFATAAFASAAALIMLKHWPPRTALVDLSSGVLVNDYNSDAAFVSVAREVC